MKHREEEARLLEAIKAMLPKLEAILAQTEEPWGYATSFRMPMI
jgi:hypothetical protein